MDTIRQYFDSLKGKEIAVVGLGVSHRPLIRLLLQEGLSVTAYDKKTMEELNLPEHLGSNAFLDALNLLMGREEFLNRYGEEHG